MSDLQTTFELLHSIVGNGHRAQRHAPMTASGTSKYYTVLQPLSDDQIAAHLTGSATYAVPLIGTDELASAGLIEQDAGGIETAGRILAAAEQRGVTMFAIVVKGSNGHDGCHPWALYDGRYDPKAIRAQLHQIAQDAGASTDEIHPNNTNIRLPFGLHLRSETRGRLLLQSGEIFDLDAELDAAEAAVLALPLNGQPPNIVSITHEVKPVVDNINVSTPTPARTASGTIDTRAIAAATRKRFNEENNWPTLLSDKGGVEVRGGWVCNCGFAHSHDLQIAITSQDKIVSFSPNCRWAPHRNSGKALDKFGFYVDQEHGGRYMAAVEAKAREYGLWVEPKRVDNVSSFSEPTRYTDEQRVAYNAARKAKRHQETREVLDAIYDQACSLDMSDRAHLLFVYLLSQCHDRGVLQTAPTNEQLSSDMDMCRRYVQYAFRELEANGLGKRSGGKGGLNQPNEAATWTFYRSPNLGCKPRPNAECTLNIYDLDLVLESDLARERAPALPPDDLDAWQWTDDAHGADELSELDIPQIAESAEPEAETSNTMLPVLRHCHGRYQVATSARFGGWAATAAGAWEKWYGTSDFQKSEVEPEANNQFDYCSDEGASYTPVELPERAYTGQARQYMTDADRRALALETMRQREQPAGTVNVLTLGDADADDPLVRVAPSDPKAAREYWQLKNKKAKSAKQAIWMRRRVAELEALMPLSEWKEQPAPGGVWLPLDGARPIRARSQAPNRAHIQEVFV